VQPDFFNTVVVAASEEPPEALLELAKRLEVAAGRVDGPRWGPRPLDVDLLLVGDERRTDDDLRLPHPLLRQRAFVLAPLAAVAPDLRLPPDGRRAGELLASLPDDPRLRRVRWTADE
jgi:2-amino-4-hydroxy-6-hydroxymethyldihydropteridine diphosphokinase